MFLEFFFQQTHFRSLANNTPFTAQAVSLLISPTLPSQSPEAIQWTKSDVICKFENVPVILHWLTIKLKTFKKTVTSAGSLRHLSVASLRDMFLELLLSLYRAFLLNKDGNMKPIGLEVSPILTRNTYSQQ